MQNSRFVIKIIHLQLILPYGAFSDVNTSGAPYALSHLSAIVVMKTSPVVSNETGNLSTIVLPTSQGTQASESRCQRLQPVGMSYPLLPPLGSCSYFINDYCFCRHLRMGIPSCFGGGLTLPVPPTLDFGSSLSSVSWFILSVLAKKLLSFTGLRLVVPGNPPPGIPLMILR